MTNPAIALLLATLLVALPCSAAAAEGKPALSAVPAKTDNKKVYRERIEEGDFEYEVVVDANGNTVDVVPLTEKARGRGSPQFELYSGEKDKSRRTAPVALQTIEAQDAGGTRYAGKLDRWNDNYIGFVLTLRDGGEGPPRELKREFPRAGKAENKN